MTEHLGRYEILGELGRGAMGTVYRARDPKIDRVVALKTITVAAASPAEEEAYRQRFYREAQAAGKLSHPGIVTIHDVGEDEATQTPFIVMEFIEGTTLEELGRGERLPVGTALELAQQIAAALDYAHSHQIVHRDIKPANIIVTPDGRAKITDFGVAKLQLTQFTQPGQVLGTPAYMSPEQLTGSAVDGRSDLFSLGVILYWLLTGDKPFAGDTASAVSFKIVYKDPIAPTQLNPALTPDHDYVIERALAKDPARRYPRGRELADDLEDLKNGRPPRSQAALAAPAEAERTVIAQPLPTEVTVKTTPLPTPPLVPPTAERAGPITSLPAVAVPAAKRRWLLPTAIVALLLLLLGGGWWLWRSRAGKEQQPGAAQQAAAGATPAARSRTAIPRPAREAEPRTRPVAMATLRLTGEHNFESGTLYVYADEKLIEEVKIAGQSVQRKGVRVGMGKISASIPVSAGRHTISVRIKAPRDEFDQIKYLEGQFEPGETRTLEVSLGKIGKWIGVGELTRQLTLRWLD